MRDLSVVGGIYRERCLQPNWDAVIGSAGRAAQALSACKAGSKRLHAFVGERARGEVGLLVELADFELVPTDLPFLVSFDYAHTLADPVIAPPVGLMGSRPPLIVKDQVIPQARTSVIRRSGLGAIGYGGTVVRSMSRSELADRFDCLAAELAGLAEGALDQGRTAEIPNPRLGQLIAALTRLYAEKVQAGEEPEPFGLNSRPGITDVAILCTALMDSAGLELIELGGWQTMSGLGRLSRAGV